MMDTYDTTDYLIACYLDAMNPENRLPVTREKVTNARNMTFIQTVFHFQDKAKQEGLILSMPEIVKAVFNSHKQLKPLLK